MTERHERPRLDPRQGSRKKKRGTITYIASCLVLLLLIVGFLLSPWGPFDHVFFSGSNEPPEGREGSTTSVSEEEQVAVSREAAVVSEQEGGAVTGELVDTVLCPPLEGNPLYPFTEADSIACGHWSSDPLDLPYFGAPRSGGRRHAGIDIYPAAGEGAPVRALKEGNVLRVEPFYTRDTGEKTYHVLIDHGDFVANYAELSLPVLKAGDTLDKGSPVGHVSGTGQLHLEMYAPGTTGLARWYVDLPANLLDPTEMMLELY